MLYLRVRRHTNRHVVKHRDGVIEVKVIGQEIFAFV